MKDNRLLLNGINPHALVALLVKHLWVCVLTCISAVLCFSSVCRLAYVPEYTSTATFMVSAKDSTNAYNSLTTTQSMASVFVEVFQSNILREKIAEQMPEGTFDGVINTTTIPETNLLIVTVTAPEPDTAFHALTLLVENYSTISDYLFSNAQLEVIKDPVVPVAPSNAMNLRDRYPWVMAAAVVGTCVIMVAIYLWRDTVKTPEAARRRIDARLLRTIGHERKNKTFRSKLRRKNTAPLIVNRLIKKNFIEDNMSFCSTLEYHMRRRKQQVVLVTSVGENEGKSTVAANLALALAEKQHRVVLLDCDFRKPSIHKIFEVDNTDVPLLTHWILGEADTTEGCLLPDKKHGVALGVSKAAGKRLVRLLHNGRLAQLLKLLRREAEYIILDTPPMMAAADVESIAALADTAVLVVRADFMPTSAINEGLDRLRRSAPEVCGFVLNNYRTTIM